MANPNLKVQTFDNYIDEVEQKFDSFIDHGTDHELFLSGYLHGHFSLIVSQASLAGDVSIQAVDKRMRDSLREAFAKGELEADDQAQAYAMWETVAQPG